MTERNSKNKSTPNKHTDPDGSDENEEIRQITQINGIGQNKFNKIVSLFSDPSITNKKRQEILGTSDDMSSQQNTKSMSDDLFENKSFKSKIDMWKSKIEKNNRSTVSSLEEIKKARIDVSIVATVRKSSIDSEPKVNEKAIQTIEVKPETKTKKIEKATSCSEDLNDDVDNEEKELDQVPKDIKKKDKIKKKPVKKQLIVKEEEPDEQQSDMEEEIVTVKKLPVTKKQKTNSSSLSKETKKKQIKKIDDKKDTKSTPILSNTVTKVTKKVIPKKASSDDDDDFDPFAII